MTSNQIEVFLAFLRDCEQRYHIAETEEQEANNETQDILHSLELEPHDYHEYARLSKELRDVRQRRRKAKDTMVVLAPVVSYLNGNRLYIKGLERLLGDVRKAEKKLENRVYVPRKQNDT